MAAEGIDMIERMEHEFEITGKENFANEMTEMIEIMKNQEGMDNIKKSLNESTETIFEDSNNPFVLDSEGKIVKDTEGNPKLKFKGGEYSLQEIYKMETGDTTSTSENISGKAEEPDLVKQTKALLGEKGWEKLSQETKESITKSSAERAKMWRDLPDNQEVIERSKGNEVAKDLNKDEKTKVEDRPTDTKDIEEWNKKTDKALEESGQKKNVESTYENLKKKGGEIVGKIFKYSYYLGAAFLLYDLYQIIDEHAKTMSGCWLMCSDGARFKILPLTCTDYQKIAKDQQLAVVAYNGWADMSGPQGKYLIRPSDLFAWNPCPKDPGMPLLTYCIDNTGNGDYRCGGSTDKEQCKITDACPDFKEKKQCDTCVKEYQKKDSKGVYYSTSPYPGDGNIYIDNCATDLVNTDQDKSCNNGTIRDGKCDKKCDMDILDIPRPLFDGRTFSIQCIEASWLDAANDLLDDTLSPFTSFTEQLWNIIKIIIIAFVVIWLVILFGKIIFKQFTKK